MGLDEADLHDCRDRCLHDADLHDQHRQPRLRRSRDRRRGHHEGDRRGQDPRVAHLDRRSRHVGSGRRQRVMARYQRRSAVEAPQVREPHPRPPALRPRQRQGRRLLVPLAGHPRLIRSTNTRPASAGRAVAYSCPDLAGGTSRPDPSLLIGRPRTRISDATQKALTDALQREVGRILPILLTDLRKGDGSDGESGSSFLYELVADSPSLEELQTQIAAGLAANDFTIEDVAARFVDLAYVIGGSGRPSSASFSGELFTKVTGTEARSANRAETGEWPDTTWPRRREFAAQFITPTAAEDYDAVQQQAEDQR